jgi:hypothetical protein
VIAEIGHDTRPRFTIAANFEFICIFENFRQNGSLTYSYLTYPFMAKVFVFDLKETGKTYCTEKSHDDFNYEETLFNEKMMIIFT